MKTLEYAKKEIYFPPVEDASPEGLLAIGGELSTDRLLVAYASGIFPWYNAGQPVLWWTPDPRAVLYLQDFRISRSLKKSLRNKHYSVTFNQAFEAVMRQCAAPRRDDLASGEPGTWITQEMMSAYTKLHKAGYAHSVETWLDEQLVGGLYGVCLGRAFFGESMFSTATDASKVAMANLVALLRQWQFKFIDCQLPSDHLFSLGAKCVPREQFLRDLTGALAHSPSKRHWPQSTPNSHW